MPKKPSPALNVFKTDRRIRLGIWGLGRGMSFYRTCRALNIDVVAGCDFNAHMRDHFLAANPGATVTADADAFLAQDFDAVLLATYCPAHAADAIRCLEAGKHVLSEVTAFHTLAEGVRLVEAVERSGKVYNLAENYPWTPTNSWLARQWKTGLFGELMYAEYEYVHEVRSLCYTYIDGLPVKPGHHVHSWRSWLNYHYYNTHSLGPAMVITGTRPVRVVALPGAQQLAGYPGRAGKDMGGIAPSLITMSNGGIVRNLMGATTSDTHAIRLWGTRGAAEKTGHGLHVRLGGSGDSPMMEVRPSWDSLGELAAQSGHGGGDFWVLYYFARQILEGTPSPWDLYPACDVTIPGMQAYRSSLRDGEPQPCPDLRDPAAREACRHDDWRQEHLDPQEWAFPPHMRDALAESFSSTMKDLIRHALTVRAALDWEQVLDDAVPQVTLLEMVDRLIAEMADLKATYAQARRIIDTHPQANAARVLREMLEDIGAEAQVLAPGFTAWARRLRARLVRLLPAAPLRLIAYRATALQPNPAGLASVRPPRASLKFQRVPYDYALGYADVRSFHGEQDGLLYVRATATPRRPGKGLLRFGADGPVKVWINGKLVATELAARNPILPMRFKANTVWRRGRNEILFALDSRKGQTWGLAAACESTGKG